MNEHYSKGLEEAQKDNYQEAILAFNRSLLLRPNHPECLYNRGLAKFYLERYLDAIQDFDLAIRFAPEHADIYSQRGVAKFLLKEVVAALKDMDKALELEPQNPYRYTSRAYIRAKMGNALDAINDYKIALKLDPEDAIAWNNLGMLEQSLGMKDAAKGSFSKADSIADEGKEFEKPDIEEILKEAREQQQKITLQQEQRVDSPSMKNVIQMSENEPEKQGYWQVVKEVFTTKAGFADFMQFVKTDLLGKK